MTTTPDLQRIVEALKACRERYIRNPHGPGQFWAISERGEDRPIFVGTRSECLAYIDARYADAMVRAIREPGQATVEAGGKIIFDGEYDLDDFGADAARQVHRAMCDAILGETQP